VEPCAQVTAAAYRFEDGKAAAAALLASGARPEALLCANDLLALGAMNAVYDAGLAVPADVAVVGFDDIFFSRFFNPALTTVAQPMRRIGAEAAELLIDLIEGRRSERRRLLPVHLVERASTTNRGGSHGAI
jgi:DNA-binding LacI/PurR family transcriptional regulator